MKPAAPVTMTVGLLIGGGPGAKASPIVYRTSPPDPSSPPREIPRDRMTDRKRCGNAPAASRGCDELDTEPHRLEHAVDRGRGDEHLARGRARADGEPCAVELVHR